MILCPVCEHQQAAGTECEVCGKDLSAALGAKVPAPAPVQPMAELEVTVPARVGAVPAERIADLEPNATAAANLQVPTAPMAELDTARVSVGPVPVEVMADLALDRAEFVGQKTAAPGAMVQCRYCGKVSNGGQICDGCGMRLPRAPVGDPVAVKTEWVRCRFCGSPGHSGERCKECGRTVASA